MLWGAIVGDIVGSVYEFNNIRTKDFPFFSERCFITDDSYMTIAVARALMNWRRNGGDLQQIAAKSMRDMGRRFPSAGYGTMFANWLERNDSVGYNSWGNGAAMRVSAAGWVGLDIADVKNLSYMVTSVTHNHIEGIKGAEATAVAVFMARIGKDKEEIAQYIRENYYKQFIPVSQLQETYHWHSSCQGTVPPALQCFFESENYQDAIRNAISIGGDSDTIGAITGAVAGAYYGVPAQIKTQAEKYVPDELMQIITEFSAFVG